jgi:hypothetical protein
MNSINFLAGARTSKGPGFFARLGLGFRAFWNVLRDRTVVYGCDVDWKAQVIKTSNGALAPYVTFVP